MPSRARNKKENRVETTIQTGGVGGWQRTRQAYQEASEARTLTPSWTREDLRETRQRRGESVQCAVRDENRSLWEERRRRGHARKIKGSRMFALERGLIPADSDAIGRGDGTRIEFRANCRGVKWGEGLDFCFRWHWRGFLHCQAEI